MELTERKEKKQKELKALELKHRRLMEYVDELKKKSHDLDQEICELTEKRSVLQNRWKANKIADELDQYKEAFRPENSVGKKPEPISSENVEKRPPQLLSEEASEELPDELSEPDSDTDISDPRQADAGTGEIAEETEQSEVPQENDLQCEQSGAEDPPDSALDIHYVLTQRELLELVRSIGQRQSEEIVVREISAGAKVLEIFHDITGKFFKVLIMGVVMILLSLAVTVLINADLRNTLLEFVKNVGV